MMLFPQMLPVALYFQLGAESASKMFNCHMLWANPNMSYHIVTLGHCVKSKSPIHRVYDMTLFFLTPLI